MAFLSKSLEFVGGLVWRLGLAAWLGIDPQNAELINFSDLAGLGNIYTYPDPDYLCELSLHLFTA
jgi:hypothetical protein